MNYLALFSFYVRVLTSLSTFSVVGILLGSQEMLVGTLGFVALLICCLISTTDLTVSKDATDAQGKVSFNSLSRSFMPP